MSSPSNPHPPSGQDDFAQQAELARPGLLHELWLLIRYNKRWWITPIILLLLLVALFAVLGSTAAAPFIYTLF